MPHTAYLWIAILPVCMAFGAFYCAVRHTGSALIGAIYGCFIGGGIMMFEKGAPFPQLRDRLHRLSWLLSNAGTEVIYLVLTIVGAGLAGGLMWTLGLNGESLAEALVIHPPAILYSLLVSGFIVTVVPVRDLIGAEVFRNMLFGRYHRPLEEERIFLFIDLTGCTAYAQAHGDRQAQTYLGAYLATTPQM